MINAIIKKNTVRIFLALFSYKIILELTYYYVISQMGDYMKFELFFNRVKLVESYLLLFLIFVIAPKSYKKISDIVIWMFILLSYVPMLVLYAFMNKPRTYMYAVSGFWLFVFMFRSLPNISIPQLKQSQSLIIRTFILIFLPAVAFFLIYKYLTFSLNFNIEKVYEIRAEYLKTKIPFAGYLFNWVAYVINPILFAHFLVKRRLLFLVLTIALQIFIFFNTGCKTFLFALPLVLCLMWMVTQTSCIVYMALGLSGVIILGIFSNWLINDEWILFLFARRTLLVPAQLSFFYYDLFSKDGFLFFSCHKIFRSFLEYPYDVSPAHLIATRYLHRPECNATVGMYADAYMNFGLVGLILWSILLSAFLKFIDSCSKRKDLRIVIATIAMPVIVLLESPLLTSLLTHGVFLALLVLFLLPKMSNINTLEQTAIQL